MTTVFKFIDETRKNFWKEARKESEALIDPKTGSVFEHLINRVDCPVCGVDQNTVIFKKDGFSFVRCHQCGLLHVNPQLKKDIGESFYKRSNMADHWIKVQTGKEEQDWNEKNKYGPALEAIKALRPNGGRLLDIGCSVGQFMSLSKNYNWDPIGLELNEPAANYAREIKGLDVRTQYLEEAGFEDESFDMITLWGVFEHLIDPNEMLKMVRKLLRPKGLILTFVPNGNSLLVRLMRGLNSTVHGRGHLWYFTPQTLDMILRNQGFIKVDEFSVLPQLHEIMHYLQYNVPYQESAITCEEEFVLDPNEKTLLENILSSKKMGYKLITIAERD